MKQIRNAELQLIDKIGKTGKIGKIGNPKVYLHSSIDYHLNITESDIDIVFLATDMVM